MTIDLAKYDINKAFAIDWYEGNSKDNVRRGISTLGQMLGIPLIVVAFWIGPHTNWHPDAVKAIKDHIAYYGYTEILNKPEGSPI